MYQVKQIGGEERDAIRELFLRVFTAEPWKDDWSDRQQLEAYLEDLTGQSNSLTYGLYEDGELLGVSMGHSKHWYSGTEYMIEEFCIRTERQRQGLGTLFMEGIEAAVKERGLTYLFLLTEKDVPAYEFYRKNEFTELKGNVAFAKRIR